MTAMSSAYARRLLQTLFLLSFGTYLFLATVTYTPFDPGWMHISSDTQQVSNASGVAGAWLADLMFGFLGWASLLIPLYFFIEAVQVWWPRSFLTRPFRYAAQFFILLATSSLLYLFWEVPADTLANASGGIIGYELGQSLTGLLTIYGAAAFLIVFLGVLFTLAFGVKWNKTLITLKALPAQLQDLFYKNVPESESAFDRTTPEANQKNRVDEVKPQIVVTPAAEHQPVQHAPVRDAAAERLFNEMLNKERQAEQRLLDQAREAELAKQAEQERLVAEQQAKIQAEQDMQDSFAEARRVQEEQSRAAASNEVWRALHSQEAQKQEIDALLKAADEDAALTATSQPKQPQQLAQAPDTDIDWDDDQVFDELMASVPQKTALKEESDVVVAPVRVKITEDSKLQPVADAAIEAELAAIDEILKDQPRVASSYAQSSACVQAPIQTVVTAPVIAATTSPTPETIVPVTPSSQASETVAVPKPHNTTVAAQPEIAPVNELEPASEFEHAAQAQPVEAVEVKKELSKQEFIEAWQQTAGEPQALEDEFDAPLTDAHGRPMSRAMQVAQKRLDLSPLPSIDLLDEVDPNKKVNFTQEQLARLSELLEIKLQEFNVKAKVVEAQPGPVVTRFELDLAPGVKASKVTNISRDLARSMSMASVRVVEVIPGKPYIGIEVPNSTREMVRLIELIQTPAFTDPNGLLSMAMGKDISGHPVIADLGKAPHMLVAGTTGSGKSVAVNSMILSMLLKYNPDQLRLILIDPKQLELANYSDIPHLLTPVVTDMKDAVNALNWCVNEMERRYKLMSFLKIRKLADYNRKVEEALANGEDLIDPTWKASESVAGEFAPRLQPLPSIVIVADEFADMIMQVGKKAEEMITRLAQKSRAAGIHLLLATQRPSVDVITGLIKANIPTRAALRVNSKIDSRTILDASGAEDLLGHGDMLFLGPGKIEPERVHGAFISDDEVNRICDAWRERGAPNYVDEILTPYDEEPSSRGFEEGEGGSDRDALYDQCVAFVLETRKATTSSLQRKFSLGYNRAARIIDQMEEGGIVSAMGANGKREILV